MVELASLFPLQRKLKGPNVESGYINPRYFYLHAD